MKIGPVDVRRSLIDTISKTNKINSQSTSRFESDGVWVDDDDKDDDDDGDDDGVDVVERE